MENAINLSNERITEIANKYLGDKGPLEKVFKDKFGTELPEILNESHRIFIVASEIDASSERIIEYLSDSYGVGINAVTFRSSVAFIGLMGENKSRKTIFSIVPGRSSAETGIQYEVYVDRLVEYFGINNKKAVADIFSFYKREGDRDGGEFGKGYFRDNKQIEEFLRWLNKIKQK